MNIKKKQRRKRLIDKALVDLKKIYKEMAEQSLINHLEYTFYDFLSESLQRYEIYADFEFERRDILNKYDYYLENKSQIDNDYYEQELQTFFETLLSQNFGEHYQKANSKNLLVEYLKKMNIGRRISLGLNMGYENYESNMTMICAILPLVEAFFYGTGYLYGFSDEKIMKPLNDSCSKKLRKNEDIEEFDLFIPIDINPLQNLRLMLNLSQNQLKTGNTLGFQTLLNVFFDNMCFSGSQIVIDGDECLSLETKLLKIRQ